MPLHEDGMHLWPGWRRSSGLAAIDAAAAAEIHCPEEEKRVQATAPTSGPVQRQEITRHVRRQLAMHIWRDKTYFQYSHSFAHALQRCAPLQGDRGQKGQRSAAQGSAAPHLTSAAPG